MAFMSRIRVSCPNVHIICGDTGNLMILGTVGEFYLTSGKVWIMAAKWDVVLYEMDHMHHYFQGSLSFSHQKREIPGFENFLKIINLSKYPEDLYFSRF